MATKRATAPEWKRGHARFTVSVTSRKTAAKQKTIPTVPPIPARRTPTTTTPMRQSFNGATPMNGPIPAAIRRLTGTISNATSCRQTASKLQAFTSSSATATVQTPRQKEETSITSTTEHPDTLPSKTVSRSCISDAQTWDSSTVMPELKTALRFNTASA